MRSFRNRYCSILNTYILTGADVGKFIAVGVTPVATAGSSPGVEVISPYQGPIIPGDATFSLPIEKFVASFDDVSVADNDFQGVIENGANAITFTVPFSPNTRFGALNSPLKFTKAGNREDATGISKDAGSISFYWAVPGGTGNEPTARWITSNPFVFTRTRQSGNPVRCIKE